MKDINKIIDSLHLIDVKNELHPSIFDDNEEYSMLIVRVPVIRDELTAKSLSFIITSQVSYYYNKEEKCFEELKGKFMGPYMIVNKHIDKLLKSFLKYQDVVLDMEEGLYNNSIDKNFLNDWLSVKLEILRIERTLLKTTNTMDDFIEYYKNFDEFPMNHFVDVHEHIERTMRSATLQLSKLDYLYSFYNAKSNDKMNKMIYFLTIISAVFLPLNLIVGFFGMNTTSLPFSTGENGTYFAISLMLTLVVVTTAVVQVWRKKVES